MPCRCATSCATAPDGHPPVRQATRGILANRPVGCEIGSVPGTDRLLVVRREAEAAADRVLREHAVTAVLGALQRLGELPGPVEERHHADLEAGAVEHHDAGLARLERGDAVEQRGEDPVADLLGRLLPRDPARRVLDDPRGVLLGIADRELLQRQAGALADVVLPQPRVGLDRQPAGGGDVLRGLESAGEVARPQAGRVEGGEDGRDGLGLGAADGVQRDVGVPLRAALRVPVGLAVPDQDQGAGRSRGARVWRGQAPWAPAVTSAGSSIRGQSRHSRSRA